MKLISIKTTLLARYSAIDKEFMIKDRRPTVLVVRLKYRNANYDFAVPLRSNIAPATPKNQHVSFSSTGGDTEHENLSTLSKVTG